MSYLLGLHLCALKKITKSFDWLYWLLVKSDFEIGEHAP